MDSELVLTVIAQDRPGLIKALSETIAQRGGNWIDSSMARLGGEFAGILRVTVPVGEVSALETALGKLHEAGISVVVRKGEKGLSAREGRRVRLDLTGVDHPGIIHRISTALSGLDVSIDELETKVSSGSMSGEPIFEANAKIRLPDHVSEEKLRETLEGVAKDLMVDVELSPV